MQTYNLSSTRRHKKLIKIVIGIIITIIAAFCVLGIVVGSDNENRQSVSSAVRENVQLKMEINELNSKIEELEKQIQDLNDELSVRPTAVPTPYVPDVDPRRMNTE